MLDAAARFLEARPRSVAEVRRRLVDAGYRPDLVDGAVERLLDLGMLDDAAFATAWVESRDRASPRGARALRDELRRKGIAPEVIEGALAEREAAAGGDGEAQLESAAPAPGERATSAASDRGAADRLLARRGAAVLREPDPRRRAAKAYALLARNGFDPDVCREASRAWLAGAGDPDDAGGDAEPGEP